MKRCLYKVGQTGYWGYDEGGHIFAGWADPRDRELVASALPPGEWKRLSRALDGRDHKFVEKKK